MPSNLTHALPSSDNASTANFTLAWPRQRMAFCGVGLCDPSLQGSLNAAKAMRYSKFLLTATIPGDGGDMTIPVQTINNILAAGVGDAGAPLNIWWVITTSDSDVFPTGYLPGRGFYFILVGLQVQFNGAYQRGGTGVATDPKFMAPSLTQAENGYQRAIAQAVFRDLHLQATAGDNGCVTRLGLANQFPSPGGAGDSLTPKNGSADHPAAYMPLNTAYCCGPRDSEKQISITAALQQAQIIGNNPAAPLVVTGRQSNGTVYIEIQVNYIGFEVCLPDVAQCRPMSPAELAAYGMGQ